MDYIKHAIGTPARHSTKTVPPRIGAQRTDRLTEFLRELNSTEQHIRLSKTVRHFVGTFSISDFALAFQNLLAIGVPVRRLIRLCYDYTSIFPSQAAELRVSLPSSHIVRTILCEHEMFRCFLADLEAVEDAIRPLEELSNASSEFRKLSHVASHLALTEMHNEREDEIIFPQLEKHGPRNLVMALRIEHNYMSGASQMLNDLVLTFGITDLVEFKRRLTNTRKYMVPALTEHLFKEDNILYPLALNAVTDKQVWERIKALCDEIGYCCFENAW
ncbi:MAG: hemerythrin domain-containing protein [Planctomycetota bacterium]